jgi:hypothetical protein
VRAALKPAGDRLGKPLSNRRVLKKIELPEPLAKRREEIGMLGASKRGSEVYI